MAIVTKGNEGNEPMADDELSGRGDEGVRPEDREEADREEGRGGGSGKGPGGPVARGPATAGGGGGGFFSIYKPGQGYWTRLGTVIAVALLITLVARFIYTQLDALTNLDVGPTGDEQFPTTKLAIVGVFVVAVAGLVWHYINKPSVVDFLVATESEMKKVNWTSRKELMGSTKVVIVFMMLIALILFVFDLIFGWFFYLIRVLHQPPF